MIKHPSLRWLIAVAVSVLMLALSLGCGDDNGAEPPEFGTVSGTVTFVGTPPTKGEVQVSIWTSWPPMGPPAAATEPLDTGATSATYKIEGLSDGTYPIVTVGWRDPADPTGALVLGMYWADKDSVGMDPGKALPITIDENNRVWENVDIKANLDIAP